VTGLHETADHSLPDQARSFPRDREALLMLDNVERNPNLAPVVSDLLDTAPERRSIERPFDHNHPRLDRRIARPTPNLNPTGRLVTPLRRHVPAGNDLSNPLGRQCLPHVVSNSLRNVGCSPVHGLCGMSAASSASRTRTPRGTTRCSHAPSARGGGNVRCNTR
jgi:hypothetical protein